MTVYFPQCAASLQIIFEDFGNKANPLLKQAYTVDVQCKRARVEINSYREADTFEIELDYNTLPFDPRTIRSCKVSVHMEDMHKLYEKFKHFNDPVKIDTSQSNIIFHGFADEDQMIFNDSSRTVKLKGRDFTGIFIDARWGGKLTSLTKPVDKVIEDIVASLKGAGGEDGVKVDNRTGEKSLPALASFYPDFGVLSGKRSAKPRESYWDVIQDIVSKAGLIAYIEIDKLVLTRPRTLYDPDRHVKFVYGHDVKEFELTRKMGRQKGFNIVVRSLIDKKVEEVRIPRDSTKLDIGGADVFLPKQDTDGKLVAGNEAIAPFIAFVVDNMKSRAALINVGEKIFEEISRQQIEGKFSTHNLDAPFMRGGGADCFSLLKLRNGTPIKVEIAPNDLKGINLLSSQAEKVLYLTDRCWDERVAAVFAATMGKYQTPFYTKSVTFSFDITSGLKIDVDFINHIETGGKGLGI